MERSTMVTAIVNRWKNESLVVTGATYFADSEDMTDLAEMAVEALHAVGALGFTYPALAEAAANTHALNAEDTLSQIEQALDTLPDRSPQNENERHRKGQLIHGDLRRVAKQTAALDPTDPVRVRAHILTERVLAEVFGFKTDPIPTPGSN